MHTHVLFSVHFSSYLTHKTGVNVNRNFSWSVQVDILLVHCTHLWDIKSNIWREIPYLLSYFAYYKSIQITKFLTIFLRFPKILQKLYKGRKTSDKDPKIFRSYINNFKFSSSVKTWSQRSHQYLYWWRYRKHLTRVARVVSYKCYEWCIFQ